MPEMLIAVPQKIDAHQGAVNAADAFIEPKGIQQSFVHRFVTGDNDPILHQSDAEKREQVGPGAGITGEEIDHSGHDGERRNDIQ
jgi:hypothetical protein